MSSNLIGSTTPETTMIHYLKNVHGNLFKASEFSIKPQISDYIVDVDTGIVFNITEVKTDNDRIIMDYIYIMQLAPSQSAEEEIDTLERQSRGCMLSIWLVTLVIIMAIFVLFLEMTR